MHHHRRRALPALALLAAVALGGCGGQDAATPPAPEPPAAASTGTRTPEPRAPVQLAVVGDSITQADGDVPAGRPGASSWVSAALTEDVVFAGGWARGGATTADMLAAVRPVHADVLVVLAGTNDPGAGLSGAQTAANLRAIVAGVGADRVVVSAVPPRDAAPEVAVATNQVLAQVAREEGWVFADPMAGIRQGDRYAPGMSDDGLHPTQRASFLIGRSLRATVLEVAGH